MPSRDVYNFLIRKGYPVDSDPYSKYDCLESNDDLVRLFEVLNSVQDKNGNPAVLTANVLVANPDFNRIKNNHFEQYYYELVTETFQRYPAHNNAFLLWQEGSQNKVFIPQFHGREHLNVDRWMLDLQNGNRDLQAAFKQQMPTFSFLPCYMRFGYMEGLDFFTEDEKQSKHDIISDGYYQFSQLLGYDSQTFIANCYIWHPSIEPTLAELGVKAIQGNVFQLLPSIKDEKHKFKRKLHFTGQKNNFGQIYLVRNAHFEPSLGIHNDSVGKCLAEVQKAFESRKPAIIGSHRLNFIGGIFPQNSSKNLKRLQLLLRKITSRWPDIEFMSSASLANVIRSGSNKI